MVVIALKLDDNKVSNKFLKDTHTRLTTPTYKNFFCKGMVKSFKDLHIIYLEILFVKFYYLGFMFIIGSLIWNNGSIGWSIIPGILFTLPIIFWSPSFSYLLLRLGLKKAGYEGKVKRVYLDKAICQVINYE